MSATTRAWRRERIRWAIARLFLRWAGALLARSHPVVLHHQTSGRMPSFVFMDGDEAGIDSYVFIKPPPRDPREEGNDHVIIPDTLRAEDAHGLLLQLAAAAYQADHGKVRHDG